MLEQNDYVRCLMIDFTKAFDTVDHVILLHNLSQLSPPGFVINWICSFLFDRGKQCKINGLLSDVVDIGLSIVQRSVIGPTVCIIIFKYADDVTLLVPQHTDVELDVEFQNVKACAATNCLKLNLSKTKEIVFKWPRVQYFHVPPLVDIEQLDCCKLLGVIFQSNFKMNSHIQFILSQCAQRQYLLRLLHHQGLPDAELSVIAFAVIISRLVCPPCMGRVLVCGTCQRN